MENFSLFDIISLSLILILGIKGVINGFVKEVFGLLGIVGGIFLASRYAELAGKFLSEHLYKFGNDASSYLFGFITVLIAVWIICIFLGYIIAQAIGISGLSSVDKIAGLMMGSLKIFLVFSVFAVALNNIEFIKSRIEPYTVKSMMFPLLLQTGNYIIKLDTKRMLENLDHKPSEKN